MNIWLKLAKTLPKDARSPLPIVNEDKMSNHHKFKDSTACAHCDYDDDTSTLKIKFHSSDAEHWHSKVPKKVYEDFKAAESPGKFFHAHIRRQFPGVKQ